jgi:membrane-bound serine protease (ClpP class)
MGFNFEGVMLTGLIKSFFIVVISGFLAIVLSFYFGRKLLTSTTFGHLALDSIQESKEGFTSSDSQYKNMIGKTGVAHTVLRPAGKVRVESDIYDATAEAGFIDKDTAIKVTGYQTGQLIVKKDG